MSCFTRPRLANKFYFHSGNFLERFVYIVCNFSVRFVKLGECGKITVTIIDNSVTIKRNLIFVKVTMWFYHIDVILHDFIVYKFDQLFNNDLLPRMKLLMVTVTITIIYIKYYRHFVNFCVPLCNIFDLQQIWNYLLLKQ